MNKTMLETEFSPSSDTFVLGGPIWIKFSNNNLSDTHDVEYVIGYGRSDGYRFEIKNEEKHNYELLDPYIELGGLAAVTTLGPKQTAVETILLNKYFKFNSTGKFKVHSELDLDIQISDGTNAKVPARGDINFTLVEDEDALNDVYDEFLIQLQGGKPDLQLQILEIVGELRNSKSLPILAAALNSDNSAFVESAIGGLGKLGGNEAAMLLTNFSNNQSVPEKLRSLAAQTLSNMQ